jgi:hypothetical protein
MRVNFWETSRILEILYKCHKIEIHISVVNINILFIKFISTYHVVTKHTPAQVFIMFFSEELYGYMFLPPGILRPFYYINIKVKQQVVYKLAIIILTLCIIMARR